MNAPPARANAVGRNDPCPCGSGQKYKKCCADKQAIASAPIANGASQPAGVDALTDKGYALFSEGRLQEAFDTLNQAIAMNPSHAMAYVNRGYVLCAQGNWLAMMDDFIRAKDLEPNNPFVHYNIGRQLYNYKDYFQAIQPLNFAIELRPDFEETWVMLADCYYRIGSMDIARNIYLEIQKRFPNSLTDKLELAYILPPIPASNAEIDEVRVAFMHNLDRLIQEHFTIQSVEAQVRYLPFYQGYHGRDNKAMMEKMAEFFYISCPSLNYVAPHVSAPLVAKPKIRIGFMLDFLLSDVIGLFMQSILEEMIAGSDFDATIFITNATLTSPQLKVLLEKLPQSILLPSDLEMSRKLITKEKLDILVYTEIGMSIQCYFLAMAKLAPIQCDMGAHPVTSGMKTIDYYLSFRPCEPENAQAHYTEKLILFERNLAVFKRPKLPESIMTRQQLGLPLHERLYCCPVLLFKIHPDMDAVFARILERDANARIILFDSSYKTLWRSKLEKRFASQMPPQSTSRITFLPHASKELFFQILFNVDAILDTMHFSFGTTSFLALSANLPFVTWPGEFARGRGPYMMYKQMGVMDLVAKTHDDYVELALRLAKDPAFRAEMAEKIRAHSDVLFDDSSAIEVLAVRLKQLYLSHST